MWIRFENPEHRKGIFQFIWEARAQRFGGSDALTADEQSALWELEAWFNENLERPPWNIHCSNTRFWFKRSAVTHLRKAMKIACLIRKAGIPIRMVRLKTVPGILTWEDSLQASFRMDDGYLDRTG